MLNHEMFTRIVDLINDQYSTGCYLPAEYIWQDHVHCVKAFGKVIWDSDNDPDTSEAIIYNLCDNYIQKYILANIWKQQAECFEDEILFKLRDNGIDVDSDLYKSFEDYFESELKVLEEK